MKNVYIIFIIYVFCLHGHCLGVEEEDRNNSDCELVEGDIVSHVVISVFCKC